jgi:hypothetical protein
MCGADERRIGKSKGAGAECIIEKPQVIGYGLRDVKIITSSLHL